MTKPPLFTTEDLESEARTVLRAYVRRPLVLLTYNRQGIRSSGHGAGTIVASDPYGAVVLTAAHIAERARTELLSAATVENEFIEDVAEAVFPAPRRADVAFIRLKEKAVRALAPYAVSRDVVETGSIKVRDGDLLVLGGFPRDLVDDVPRPAGGIENRFADGIRYTREHGHDNKEISISWSEARSMGPLPPSAPAGQKPGDPMPLKFPEGNSGGPVFLIQSRTREQLWSPHDQARLIAVANRCPNRRQLAVLHTRWAEWFLNAT